MATFGDILVGAVKLVGKAGVALLDATANRAEAIARKGSYNGRRLSDEQRAKMLDTVNRYRQGRARSEVKRQLKDMGLDDDEIERRLKEMGFKQDD